jgi:hypothetical protein
MRLLFEKKEVIKMIDINIWMKNFIQTLNETFENRVWFVGLQGSYGRGEAGKPVRHYEHSDAGGN